MNVPIYASRAARAAAFSLLVALSLAACGYGTRSTADPARGSGHLPAQAVGETADTRALDRDVNRASSLGSAISGLHQPRPDLYTAGQPEPAAWQVAAGNGITTVINLRPVAEMGDRDEAAEVAAAGLEYHQLPVAGAEDINMANAIELRRLIDQAPGPILLHCASGNRVGALLALGESQRGALPAEQALAFGRSAGLGSLESRVREVIESEVFDSSSEPACEADASC